MNILSHNVFLSLSPAIRRTVSTLGKGFFLAALCTASCALGSPTDSYYWTTFAGGSSLGWADGTGTAAQFIQPYGITFDQGGNLVVNDNQAAAVRKITRDAVVTTFAGTAGFGDNVDGVGTAASFTNAIGVAMDGDGNLFVASSQGHVIRKITPARVVTTFAGTAYASGSADGTGADARFNSPCGVAVDGNGNVFVSDLTNSTIRKITPAGVVTTFAGTATVAGSADGTGAAAQFDRPRGITADGSGNFYVADTFNHTIRRVTSSGVVTTLAGTAGAPGGADGVGAAARFQKPTGLVVDGEGTIFVADADNHTIRKITTAGEVSTIGGVAGSSGIIDGEGANARFNQPFGVAVDADGNLFVTDSKNGSVRKGVLPPAVSTASLSNGAPGVAYSQALAVKRGLAPYSWSLANGTTLPAGLSLSGDGTISGTPTASGTTAFTVQVTDATGRSGTRQMSVTVINPPQISLPTLPAGSTGIPYGTPLTVDGGTGPFDWTVESGSLPPGVTLGSNGTFSGTPTEGGSYTFTLKVTDANGATGTQTYTLEITGHGYVWTTLAGTAEVIGSADGTGAAAQFNSASAVAVDGSGNLFIADAGNHIIRKVTPDGVVTTFAGTAGQSGSADGTGATARFKTPSGVAVDGAGTVYVADSLNHTIRKITTSGEVTTLAGTAGQRGSADGTGAAARFDTPVGLVVDGSGNLFVADVANNTVRKITSGGEVTTLAGTAGQSGSVDGTGAAARFKAPYGLTIAGGNVFVADALNSTVRKITSAGVVTTFAGSAGQTGTADGTGAEARFQTIYGIAADGDGNIFVADAAKQTIRKITSAGVVTTIGGTAGLNGSADGMGKAALFHAPYALSVDASGNLFVAEFTNNIIRKGEPPPTITIIVPDGTIGAAYSVNLANSGGTAPFTWSLTAGALPAGLSLSADGAITGTPTVLGKASFTVQVSGGNLQIDTRTYDLSILAVPTISVTPPTAPTAGETYSYQMTLSGGVSPFVWSISSGTLPDGMTLGSDGLLSGTPSLPGTYGFTLQVTDANGVTATQAFSFVVKAATPAVKVPTLTVAGKKKVTTEKALYKVTCNTTDATQVYYRVGTKGAYKVAKKGAGTAWSFNAKLKPGKNTVSIYAKGAGGVSQTKKITVVRKD